MCAEFTPGSPMELQQLFEGLAQIGSLIREEFKGRVYPHGRGYFWAQVQGKHQLIPGEFGLVPSWWKIAMNQGKSKSRRPLFATYNARLDTIREKKSFRQPFLSRHCIVPLSAFFESSYFGEGFAGHRIEVRSDQMLLAAGIYDEWIDHDTGEVLSSFSIVTHDPPESVFKMGHDRCPVFFDRSDSLTWVGLPPDSDKSYEFCISQNKAAKILLSGQVDRALAPGWEKRAPDEKEIAAITRLA